jgi:hypothetical protein
MVSELRVGMLAAKLPADFGLRFSSLSERRISSILLME